MSARINGAAVVAVARSARCAVVRTYAPSPITGVAQLGDRHVRRCLTCQAETARERGLVRSLAELRSTTELAPPSLVRAVDAGIRQSAPSVRRIPRASGWRRPRMVAASAASALAIGVAVAATRRLRAIPV